MKNGFTLAETLITLGIIGIVAAITIPTLINNIQDRQYRTARKVVLATIGEAIRQISVQDEITEATNAKEFVNNYLSKRIKIIQTCENSNLKSCGLETDTHAISPLFSNNPNVTMPTKIKELSSQLSDSGNIDTSSKSYGFVLANGYAINLFYNPKCMVDDTVSSMSYSGDRVCVNIIYDMNGLKKPNTIGKDIGILSILYPGVESKVFSPDVYNKVSGYGNFNKAPQICTSLNKDLVVPNKDELASMYFNKDFMNIPKANYWSSSTNTNGNGWYVAFYGGGRRQSNKNSSYNIICIRR